jgi:LEA14-like dessication related protein
MSSRFKNAGLLILLSLLGACSALQGLVEKPTVQVQQVQYRNISLEEGRLDSKMRLYNPNSFKIPLREVRYTLHLNDRSILTSKLAFDKTIPANGSVDIQVPIQFRYRDVLNGLASILQQRRIRFQISGDIDFGVIVIPFSKTGEFAPVR